MEFKIRDEILNKENISKGEFFTLLVGYFAGKISDVYISQLKNKYLVDKNNEITGNGIEIVERILVDSEYYDDKVNFDELAEIIRSKFPEGNKLGTSYKWKGSPSLIASRLKIFAKKYGIEHLRDKDKVALATERYVNSFGGSQKYMQLAKYFIFKGKGEEENSQLLDYLNNDDDGYNDDTFGELI